MEHQYDEVELENIGQCRECGRHNILDSTIGICFDCWCVMDISEQEANEEKQEEE